MISGMSTNPDIGLETGAVLPGRRSSSDRRAKKTSWAAT